VRRRQRRTGLGLDTRLVQLISADGARICAMRVARRLSAGRARCAAACVQWAREHGGRWRPAGRGAPVQMSQDQNVTAFLSRRATPAQTPSLRPGCSHHREPNQERGLEPHHFFTTKRGPSLLSFSTSISSSSAMIPRCKLPRRGTPASGALRVGSGPGLFCTRPQRWARCVRMARGRGSRVCQHAAVSGSTRGIYTLRSATCFSGACPYPLPTLQALRWWALRHGAVAETGRTAAGESPRGGEVCGSMPPATARTRVVRCRPPVKSPTPRAPSAWAESAEEGSHGSRGVFFSLRVG
jgi:hypothetical protein